MSVLKDAIPQEFDLQPYLDPEVAGFREKPLKIIILGEELESDFQGLIKEKLITSTGSSWIDTEWVNHNRYMKFSFPKNVPFNRYPIVSNPYFSIQDMISNAETLKEIPYYSLASYFDRFSAFVVVNPKIGLPEYISDSNYMAGYLIENLQRKENSLVWRYSPDPNGLVDLTETTARELMGEAEGSMRLLYSYRLNFAAITMVAIKHCIRTPTSKADRLLAERKKQRDWGFEEETHDMRLQELRAGFVPRGLDDPLAIQLLYKVRKQGEINIAPYQQSSFVLQATLDSQHWTGTGKYKAREAHALGFNRAENALIGLGLVYIDHHNGTAGISERGIALLDMLDQDCEDADILLRWRNSATDSISGDHKEWVDMWIGNHFEKLKNHLIKQNLLP